MDMLMGGTDRRGHAGGLAQAGSGAACPLPGRRLRLCGPVRRRGGRGGRHAGAPPECVDRKGIRRPQTGQRRRHLPRRRGDRTRRPVGDPAGRRSRPADHRDRRRPRGRRGPGLGQHDRARPGHGGLRDHRPGVGRPADRERRGPGPRLTRRRDPGRHGQGAEPVVRRRSRGRGLGAAVPRRGLRGAGSGRAARVAAAVAAGGTVVDDSEAPSLTVIADQDGNRGVLCVDTSAATKD